MTRLSVLGSLHLPYKLLRLNKVCRYELHHNRAVQVEERRKMPPYCGNLLLLGERGRWKECLSFLITLLSFTLHPPYSLVALRRDVNLTVNAVRKWLVQEGQELEMGIRR